LLLSGLGEFNGVNFSSLEGRHRASWQSSEPQVMHCCSLFHVASCNRAFTNTSPYRSMMVNSKHKIQHHVEFNVQSWVPQRQDILNH
jgi:hypothetical protein